MYQLLSGKTIKLRLARIWVKCGFSSAATSAFYTFKIRRSTVRRSAFYPRPKSYFQWRLHWSLFSV